MRLLRSGPFRHVGFRLLVAGGLTSNIGDLFYAVALPWYVLATHGGVVLLGVVLAVYGIPRVVGIAVGGFAVDHWKPWTVMMAADLARAVTVTALTIAAASGPARAAVLIPIAFVLGAGEGLFIPGSFAIIPSLLESDELQAGNAITTGCTQFSFLIGPALGGAAVGLFGVTPAFAVDAATFVVSSLTLMGVRSHQHRAIAEAAAAASPADEPETDATPARTFGEFMRTERVVHVMFLVTFAANLGSGGMSEVALPSIARHNFHTGAGGYGALIASMGAGAVIGTVAGARVKHLKRPAISISIWFMIAGAIVSFAPYLGSAVGAAIALAAFAGITAAGNLTAITMIQRWVPPQLLGRVGGVIMLGSYGIFPVSVLLAGFVVHRWGAPVFFPFAGIALVVAVLLSLTQHEWRVFGTAQEESAALTSA